MEQLLLLYSNLGSSVVPGGVLAALLTITLSNDTNRNELLLWCASVRTSKLYASVHARRQLAAGITVDNATLQVTRLIRAGF